MKTLIYEYGGGRNNLIRYGHYTVGDAGGIDKVREVVNKLRNKHDDLIKVTTYDSTIWTSADGFIGIYKEVSAPQYGDSILTYMGESLSWAYVGAGNVWFRTDDMTVADPAIRLIDDSCLTIDRELLFVDRTGFFGNLDTLLELNRAVEIELEYKSYDLRFSKTEEIGLINYFNLTERTVKR